MHRRLSTFGPAAAAFVMAAIAVAPFARATSIHAAPRDRYASPPARPEIVLSAAAVARLRSEGTSTLWVTFADKGERDERSFAAAVRKAGDRVSARARARRMRETGGRFVPDWYDIPVVATYVQGVASTGASIRNVSRWLNAVSVQADEAAARRIASLPYVHSVEPARKSKSNDPIEVGPIRTFAPPARQAPRMPDGETDAQGSTQEMSFPVPVSYGSTIGQLTQINVPAVHDSGFTGAGVIVAMLDTGYDETHSSLAPLKKIAEWDFVQHDAETANEPGDVSNQWSHGTGTWAVAGGYWPGVQIGPAFNAGWLIAKTEYVPSETHVEEDNWVAAAEWADSIGADVISSSLAYDDFDPAGNSPGDYKLQDKDGQTAIVTLGAVVAHRRGIVVCNSMANSGPNASTLACPADADSILSVGAVDPSNVIAGFSSRGPTWDGRIKPEVVAQGVGVYWAIAGSPNSTGTANGTSLSCPLVAGSAALVREAHPEWTAYEVRQALMETADRAGTPDNDYGWGLIDVKAAIYSSSLGGPIHPYPFDLLEPAHEALITSVPVTLRWRHARDPQFNDPITYEVTLCTISPAQCVFTTTTPDSQLLLPFSLVSNTEYEWWVTAKDTGNHERESRDRRRLTTGTVTGAGVAVAPPSPPLVILAQSRPNPTRGAVRLDFSLSGPAGVVPVTLRIFDARGRLVRTVLDGVDMAVPHECSASWDGTDGNGRMVPSGIYHYQMEASGRRAAKRLVLVR